MALLTASTNFCPTTEPIEPPMNLNSNTAITTSIEFNFPWAQINASFSSILFFASLNLSLYFFESLKESQSFASVLAEISLYLFSSNK